MHRYRFQRKLAYEIVHQFDEEISLFTRRRLTVAPALQLVVLGSHFLHLVPVVEPVGVGEIYPQSYVDFFRFARIEQHFRGESTIDWYLIVEPAVQWGLEGQKFVRNQRERFSGTVQPAGGQRARISVAVAHCCFVRLRLATTECKELMFLGTI